MVVPEAKKPGPNSTKPVPVVDAEKQAEIDEYKAAYAEVSKEVQNLNDHVSI